MSEHVLRIMGNMTSWQMVDKGAWGEGSPGSLSNADGGSPAGQMRAGSLLSTNSGAFPLALSCDPVTLHGTLTRCLCPLCQKDNSNTFLFLPPGWFWSIRSYADISWRKTGYRAWQQRSTHGEAFFAPSVIPPGDIRDFAQSGADVLVIRGK